MVDLLGEITKQFPEVSKVESIGKSYEQRDMTVLVLGSNISQNEGRPKHENPPSIFMTSVHHAREVLGVTMNLYISEFIA